MAKTQFRGPHSRRDEKLKGGNVIKGFRLEPAAADALIKYARENFCDGRGVCNLTSAARILLRTRLGWPKSTAGDGEQLSEATRGMAMERRLVGSIKAFAEKSNLGFVPAVRHLLRVGLGMSSEESYRRELRFAQIAEARREIMEAE